MFSNSSGPSQPQNASTGHESNRNSRPSTITPSSASVRQLEAENVVPDARNQGRGQSNVRGSGYGHPIPLAIYPNFWNGLFPASEQSPGSAAGNSSRSEGYPSASASAYGPPLPHFQTGQAGEHQGVYYTPATTTMTNSLPAGHSNYPPLAPPAVYTTPNAQGEPSAVWDSVCWIERAERDEIRMTIILRRYPPA